MFHVFDSLRSVDYGQLLRAVIDISVVAYMIYRLILLARGQRAWQILIGLGVFFLLVLISDRLGLVTLNWLLRQVTPLGPVAIVILLYPELRQVLERLGRLEFWGAALPVVQRESLVDTIDEVARAASALSSFKMGALIVLEREIHLDDVVETGTFLDAVVSSALLNQIFNPGTSVKATPLHDGAVIIRGDRIVAAECRLPLSDSPNIAPTVHLRHRAAIGASENSDAMVVVVSEERGTISLAVGGKQIPGLSEQALRERLLNGFGHKPRRANARAAFDPLRLARDGADLLVARTVSRTRKNGKEGTAAPSAPTVPTAEPSTGGGGGGAGAS